MNRQQISRELVKMAKRLLAGEVAKTILEQMGGIGRIKAMTDAKNFADHGNGVSFQFPNRKLSRGNSVKVTYDRGKDLYDMEFMAIRGADIRTVKKYRGVYADQLVELFEGQTGLYLRL